MFHDPFDEQPDEPDDETVDDKELTQLIDEWLSAARPERYSADDKDWLDPIIDKAQAKLAQRKSPVVFHDAARRRVYLREAIASRRTNKILRDIDATGQLPLGWGDGDDWRAMLADILHLPLSIARQRVRFGVASVQDLDQWEQENIREEEARKEAQASARRGGQRIAQWLREQHAKRVDDLRVNGAGGADLI